ncbi:hypothetical protein ACFXGI_34585 [Streptomyces sp. NPDC059355]|uniref:hypothetical protein n=1 Tax=Streptomyces sp. NPDC059355 TaxID=3346811 RepID=UPI0036B60C67
MAGTRTSIAEQFSRTAVGTGVAPEKQTVQPQVRREAEPQIPVFRMPASQDRAERLAHCQGAITCADAWAQTATEAIQQQYLLMVSGAYELVREERLWEDSGLGSFDAWGKALNGHGADYMNKVIRIGPVVRALAPVTKRQLQEKPLRPLVSVQRDHGDDATRACWVAAEEAGDLTYQGFLKAAVMLGFKVEVESQPRPSAAAIDPARLSLAALRRLSTSDPDRALEACSELMRELTALSAEISQRSGQPDA